jgi:hypothetical protein
MVGPPHRWLNHREPLRLSSEQQILEEPADRGLEEREQTEPAPSEFLGLDDAGCNLLPL